MWGYRSGQPKFLPNVPYVIVHLEEKEKTQTLDSSLVAEVSSDDGWQRLPWWGEGEQPVSKTVVSYTYY